MIVSSGHLWKSGGVCGIIVNTCGGKCGMIVSTCGGEAESVDRLSTSVEGRRECGGLVTCQYLSFPPTLTHVTY